MSRARTGPSRPPVIGFISTWPVYQGMTIDRHAHVLMQGIRAAATDRGCDLLMGTGIDAVAHRVRRRTVWPVPAADSDFVPVGPWNTDGLIIVPDDLSDPQSEYVRDLQALGVPVVFTTVEAPGPAVIVDNTGGIHEAVAHLIGHGHRRICFVAGKKDRGGDSAERLRAFREAMAEAGLEADPELIAFGEHRFDGGAAAMRRIMRSGRRFSALIASNDLSCLGAMHALRQAGRHVPDDIAAIGFDDILDARSQTPSLTTVRHPTFALGYRAVTTLLDRLEGRATPERVVVPTRLIVRQSCGCASDQSAVPARSARDGDDATALARAMTHAALTEARLETPDQLEAECRRIVASVVASAGARDPAPLRDEVARLLARTEAGGEDTHVWRSAVSELQRDEARLVRLTPSADARWLSAQLDRARLQISEHAQRQTTRALLEHMDMLSRLGLLTSELLASIDTGQTARILAEHLPRLGIDRFLVATYRRDDEDEQRARSEVLLCAGLPQELVGRRFDTRAFPPDGIYPATERLQLIVLPLHVDAETNGFVALSAANLEPAAAIVSNLAAALRSGLLYRDALEGRRQAEEAAAVKSRFLSMVSHELRTPLSVVVGLSGMVLRESSESGALSSGGIRDLEHMQASAEHLGRLIGDVLDLASSEAGQLRLVRGPVELREVIGTAAVAGEEMARERGLGWDVRLPAPGTIVMGDRTRLRQVVLNLVSNAVEATHVGRISLEASIIGGDAVVSVSDTGVGVPNAEQARIFDEFYRSDHGRRSGSRGLGLGLAIARLLVRLHGGSLSVRSPGELGDGSTFTFRLPLAEAAEPALSLPEPGTRLALVTERPAAVARLVDGIRERGFAVDIVDASADPSWQSRLLGARPGGVILDASLAPEHGWDLVRHFGAEPGLEGVPIIACRLDDEQDRGAVLDLAFLPKPIGVARLLGELGGRVGLAGRAPGSTTVLVVDDDPQILELHARVVRETGGRALTARSGREALEAMSGEVPDLVLLDLGLPGMDGFEVLDAMRATPAMRDVPVVVVTGQTLGEDELARLDRGVASVLAKGIYTASETLDLVAASLARRRSLGSSTRRLVRRAMFFIEAHHTEPLTRERIAGHVAISPDYLTDCFHAELGLTPSAYLSRCRIRHAKELLDTTDETITDVALTVGFADISHFTRTFHRDVGSSPRAYRKRDRSTPVSAPSAASDLPESVKNIPAPRKNRATSGPENDERAHRTGAMSNAGTTSTDHPARRRR